ncbi:MAG: SpoIID/LytB domain-containing protein, partial [Pygmaiobacter sp.]
MKKTVSILLLFSFLTLFLPLATLALKRFDSSFSLTGTVPASSSPQLSGFTDAPTPTFPLPLAADTEAPLTVLNTATGMVETIPMRQFLIGSVASELPVSYQKEAFKAQTIAIHSYVLASKALQQQTPDAALHGAALRINPSLHEGYMREEALKAVWGDQFASNYAYVCAAVDEVLHEVLLYGSTPALTT